MSDEKEQDIPAMSGPEPKYYMTTITYTILSEDPIGEVTLLDIHTECEEGGWVGQFGETVEVELTPKDMATKLSEFGSEPGFFGLEDEPVKVYVIVNKGTGHLLFWSEIHQWTPDLDLADQFSETEIEESTENRLPTDGEYLALDEAEERVRAEAEDGNLNLFGLDEEEVITAARQMFGLSPAEWEMAEDDDKKRMLASVGAEVVDDGPDEKDLR